VPVITIIIASILTIFLFGSAIIFLVSEDARRTARKLYYVTRSFLGVEVGIGGLIRIMLYSGFPALAVAFQQGMKNDPVPASPTGFHWNTFFTVFSVITLVGMISNLFNMSITMRSLLSPGAGRIFRLERKVATSAILKTINLRLKGEMATGVEVQKLLSSILDIIVLHVKDHRGSFRRDSPDVFANVLIDCGHQLTVVARDSLLHGNDYHRPIPSTYTKSSMVCGRAIDSRKPLSVGMLTEDYPEAPKNKPYQSILAIPLISSDDLVVYGALSIDSTRPYFFESFVPGQVENDLENSLLPYLQLITLVLERFTGLDAPAILRRLHGDTEATTSPTEGGRPR